MNFLFHISYAKSIASKIHAIESFSVNPLLVFQRTWFNIEKRLSRVLVEEKTVKNKIANVSIGFKTSGILFHTVWYRSTDHTEIISYNL